MPFSGGKYKQVELAIGLSNRRYSCVFEPILRNFEKNNLMRASLLGLCCCLQLSLMAQTPPQQPKLVVGVVVDQMAYEFLYRYMPLYKDQGFKRLVKEGYSCENTYFSYIPTYTGPGHASVYTGSVPALNGIVSNDWFNERSGSFVYVTDDSTVSMVGGNGIGSKMSPKNMVSTTITDMLQMSNQSASKVIGIALKDRGAILPAGHMGDAAYWYDGASNAWVTSTYYMSAVPNWVNQFNQEERAQKMMNRNWELMLPASVYTASTADSVPWETVYVNEPNSAFPHYMNFNGSSESIKGTPFGNTLTAQFAMAAIKGEQLGADNITDFLCVSFSSTDYVGHAYGPHSMEIEDTYLRLDKDLGELINYLDTEVGRTNYVLFLTADHGVSPTPQYMQTLGVPAGTTTEQIMLERMQTALRNAWGDKEWVRAYTNQQIYLNDALLQASGKTIEDAYRILYQPLMDMPGVSYVLQVQELSDATLNAQVKELVINGIYPQRSGDIQILYEPYWFEAYRASGTTHGSHFSYDTHVPLLFFGWKIKPGTLHRNVYITDIAPTLSDILRISKPNASIGNVIPEVAGMR